MTTATLAAATPITRAGLTVSGTFAAATVDDQFANNGKQYLLVNNAAVGSKVLTFVTPSTARTAPTDNAGALTVQDPTVTVLATTTQIIGPFKPSIFNNSTGYVNVTVPDATSVTYKVLQADNYAATE